MKRILAPILLLTLLFPALAQGQSLNDWFGKGMEIFCETTGARMGCPESVDAKDLVETDGIYYKKYTDVPFTGKTTGKYQGSVRNGKRVGPWVEYHENGLLSSKGTYKDGKRDGPLVSYDGNGKLYYKATYKDGEKHGLWITYYTDGKLSFKGPYKNGKKDGPWFWYKDNGQLSSKGTFKNGVKVK
jgi:antitoxin component YwqK of YwqJK toxin-antitoxin module